MKVHLVDGTYELFRQNFGRAAREPDAGPYAATAGVLASTLQLLADGRHARRRGQRPRHRELPQRPVGRATRRAPACRPELLEQIPMIEEALGGDGRHDVGDGQPRGRRRARRRGRAWPTPTSGSSRSLIVTPDKDLGQCVRGTRVVQYDRRKREIVDEAGVIAKFGVPPASIPDYLGLVGDSADGFPGIAGWGAKSASAVLARYGHLEDIPPSAGQWDVPGLRGAAKLSAALQQDFALALLFRRIATVDTDVDVGAVDDWAWTGPTAEFDDWAVAVGEPRLAERADRPRRPPPPEVALLTILAPAQRERAPETLTGRRRTRDAHDPCASRRRPGDLRHTGGAAEGCYLPVLTWFAGTRCTGPDRHLVTHGSRWRQVSRPLPCCHLEGCESGRIGTLGKRVWGNPPWVRIPLPPLMTTTPPPTTRRPMAMRRIAEARRALDHGDVPIGAVVVRDGAVIAARHNERELTGRPDGPRRDPRPARRRRRRRPLAARRLHARRHAGAVRDVRRRRRQRPRRAARLRGHRPQGRRRRQPLRHPGRPPAEPPPARHRRRAGRGVRRPAAVVLRRSAHVIEGSRR